MIVILNLGGLMVQYAAMGISRKQCPYTMIGLAVIAALTTFVIKVFGITAKAGNRLGRMIGFILSICRYRNVLTEHNMLRSPEKVVIYKN